MKGLISSAFFLWLSVGSIAQVSDSSAVSLGFSGGFNAPVCDQYTGTLRGGAQFSPIQLTWKGRRGMFWQLSPEIGVHYQRVMYLAYLGGKFSGSRLLVHVGSRDLHWGISFGAMKKFGRKMLLDHLYMDEQYSSKLINVETFNYQKRGYSWSGWQWYPELYLTCYRNTQNRSISASFFVRYYSSISALDWYQFADVNLQQGSAQLLVRGTFSLGVNFGLGL